MVISWVCGYLLPPGLWSCPGCVCGHFLDRGLWSCPGWVCGHLWVLRSFPGSWSVVMSWVSGHFWVSGHLLGLHVFWVFISSGSSCLLGFHLLGLHLHVLGGSVVIFWVCGHYLDRGLWSCPGGFFGHVRSVVIFWVGDHFLPPGLWSCPGWVCVHVLCLCLIWSFPGSWAGRGIKTYSRTQVPRMRQKCAILHSTNLQKLLRKFKMIGKERKISSHRRTKFSERLCGQARQGRGYVRQGRGHLHPKVRAGRFSRL